MAALLQRAAKVVVPSVVDVVVIGGGPAGLSAALNLARARTSVLVVDANRPRNAATMVSHGYLTRDGVPPHELRKLARDELDNYPEITVLQRVSVSSVRTVDPSGAEASEATEGMRFAVDIAGAASAPLSTVHARAVLVATGLRETLPTIPNLRAFYGMSLFSCVACDGYELNERPLAFIAETADLLPRAIRIAQCSPNLTVFSNGSDAIDAVAERQLASRGIRVENRAISDLEGHKGELAAVVLDDGKRVPVTGGFVRPQWDAAVSFLDGLDVELDADGHLATDRSGRTNVAGLYAAGDVAAPGPQQLIVAAGAGARTAAVLTHDLLGVSTSH